MDSNKIIEIDVRKCAKAIVKSYRLILLVSLISMVIGIFCAFFMIRQKNEYKATSSVYSIVYGSFSESTNSLRAMVQYSDIVKSHRVAERAEILLGDSTIDKNDIYKMISTSYDSSSSNSSSKIYISALSTKKEASINVANAVADAFILEIANLTGQNDVQVLDRAIDATMCYNAHTSRLKTIIIFIFLGALGACLYISLRETLSQKMYTPRDATVYGQLDIIGVIPEFSHNKDRS